MPWECSINRSASSSSSLERSVDMRGPTAGDGASVVDGFDIVTDGFDDQGGLLTGAHTCPSPNGVERRTRQDEMLTRCCSLSCRGLTSWGIDAIRLGEMVDDAVGRCCRVFAISRDSIQDGDCLGRLRVLCDRDCQVRL